MRKYLLTFWLCLLLISGAFATPPEEGMWLLHMLKELNIKDMQAKGLKLSAEEIYSVNQASLKDAVVSFGGFCTGEVISDKGLILTNHHCGYGSIQYHSSVENDYLTDGFWAKTQADELPNKELTATFIIEIRDVSAEVLKGTDGLSAADADAKIEANIKALKAKATEGSHYDAVIKPFFYGNEYYMFITETFRDVRLVGAPPSSIGKFGGDTDNWMWPRHTGDFSLFRIYAGKDNKPADYSPDNVPFKPRHHFPISLKGVQKEDFTMVMGFPGRTQEYITSLAVEQVMEGSNPYKIRVRDGILKIMDKYMQQSDKIRIQYASKQSSVSNAWKKWIGENRGLKKLNAIERKKNLEKQFAEWVSADATRQEKYGKVLSEFARHYRNLGKVSLAYDYLNEAAFGTEIIPFAYGMRRYAEQIEAGKADEVLEKIKDSFFKDYHAPLDEEVFAHCMQRYYEDVEAGQHPSFFAQVEGKDFKAFAKKLFETSAFTSLEKFEALLQKAAEAKSFKLIQEDPAYAIMQDFLTMYFNKVIPIKREADQAIAELYKVYMQGLREMLPDKKFYPDANSTLRLSYGKVDDYYPADGVYYGFQTTLEGIIEKGRNQEVADYEVPEKLRQLYASKDYGQYGENGKMPVCFIASNHTTGGNSGSPVINAKGELIGTNFDRNWEGTMSDLMYDPDRVRNISVDIRYTLFVIDKFAGAGHLVKEMTLVK